MNDLVNIYFWLGRLNGMVTVEEIRSFLAGEGVKGTRGRYDRCPIAQFIKMKTGETVRVYETEIEFNIDVWTCDRFHYSSNSPLEEFITNFDNGRYPELECAELDANQLACVE